MKLIYSISLCMGLLVTTIPSVKGQASSWQRLNTPHFSILFPTPLEREAHRVANTLEHLYEPVSKSLKISPRRITVILRNQTTISNGFASIAPWKVEYFTFPMHDYNFLHGNDWLDLLSVHELRHVVQFELLKKKFGILPPWFFEGDAVGIETALTKGGRGRIPYFGILYKANLLERGGFSLLKQEMGSLKDPVPDYYKLGYYFTTHLRRKYGEEAIDKTFQNLGFFTSFDTALKKVTGKTAKEIYQDTNQELKQLWEQQLQGLKLTPLTGLNKRNPNPVYTDYLHPQCWEKGIIALKQGLETPTKFVWLDTQKEEQAIFIPGNISQNAGFSLAQDKLLWIEQVPDLIWKDRSYSVIQLYNLTNKKLQKLTTKSRYAAAALSHDGTKIVALESDMTYNHQLVILDSNQGKVLQRLPNPENHYYLTPKFSPDGQYVVAVKQANGQATIVLIHLESETSQELIRPTTENIGFPLLAGNYVFYNSSYSGIDNIYALDLTTQKHYQVTSSKYGAYHAAIQRDEQAIVYNDFTKDGMDAVKIPLDSSKWTPIEEVEIRRVDYYEPLVTQENNPDVLNNIPQKTYKIENFTPWKHIINKPTQLDLLLVYPQITRISVTTEDLLNTAEWTIGYSYKFMSHTGKLATQFIYKDWYPIIQVGGYLKKRFEQNQKYIKSLNLGISMPFTWMYGQHLHKLTFNTLSKMVRQTNDLAWTQTYQCLFSRFSKKSPRDLYYPWAQKFAIYYIQKPYKPTQTQLYATKVACYLPGLLKHHALRLGAGYLYKAKNFSKNPLSVATRGYIYEIFVKKETQEAYNTSLDYAFPIAYPDWELGWLYVKRFHANLFFDWGYLPASNKHLRVIGIDWLMNIPFLEIGIRYLRKLDKKEGEFDLLLKFKL